MKADSCSSGHDETGRTSVEAAANAPRAAVSGRIVAILKQASDALHECRRTIGNINGSGDWAYIQADNAETAIETLLDSLARPVATEEFRPDWMNYRQGLEDGKAEATDADAIRAMVNRFLGWPLPKTFGPDCYINFDRYKAVANQSWPVGTNLLTADEARQLFEYVLSVPVAQQSNADGASGSPAGTDDGQMNEGNPHD